MNTLAKWSLVAAIVIVLNLFFVFSTQLVLSEPQYEDFCTPDITQQSPKTQEACLAMGGQWINEDGVRTPSGNNPYYEPRFVPSSEKREAVCNVTFTCGQEYQDAREVHERNFFLALIGLGTLALIAGLVLRHIDVFALAFPLGGVLTYIIASVRYWSSMDDYLKVIALGLVLVGLLWIGANKLKDK